MAAADGRTLECDYWPVVVGGRYRGDLWLAWDMTERKQLEEQREQLLEAELAARRSAELTQRQLEMQNEKLRELDEAKTVFLATVSHELRTPLTSIVSFSELMRAETRRLTADGAQFLDIIERNAHRLLRLVGDLLLLSRLESGTIPLELAPVSVPELAAEAARAASAGAAKHGVTVHFSADEGPLIQADRTRLAQVLDNLIVNAVKFSRSNGLVRVDVIWDGGALADRCSRQRHRHPARRDRPAFRPLRPGLQRTDRGTARDRPGPVHRQGDHRTARRPRHGGQHPRPRDHVQRLPAGALTGCRLSSSAR